MMIKPGKIKKLIFFDFLSTLILLMDLMGLRHSRPLLEKIST